MEHNCLPKIVSGTSGGAIVAAVLAICTNEELISQVKAFVYEDIFSLVDDCASICVAVILGRF